MKRTVRQRALSLPTLGVAMMRRVLELLPQSTGVETAPTAPLPEAPCSVNCHVTIGGRQVQVTLRGQDETEVLTRLEALFARYPVAQIPATTQALSPQQHNAAAMHKPVTDFCQIHNTAMQLNTKDGRSWWSHRKPEGGFCKGR